MAKCTRWSELSESISFLAELSEHLEVPSQFQLVNGADPVTVGLQKGNEDSYYVTMPKIVATQVVVELL